MYSIEPPQGLVWPGLLPRAALVRAVLQQMARSERQPPEARAFDQRRQLHSLLSHALKQIPFYRDRLRAAGFRPDRPLTDEIWQAIPVLTRAQVQAHMDGLRARRVPADHGTIRTSTTSGSTGVPLRVWKTALSSIFWDAVTAREILWHRRDLSRPWHSIRYVDGDAAAYPQGSRARYWGRVALVLGKTGPGFGLDIRSDPGEQLDWLRRHQPSYLLTYPSNLRALLDATAGSERPFPRLAQVITVAESLAPGLRRQCTAQWGARVCDIYSATEVGYIALQAPRGDHYLVQDEVTRVELLDAGGAEVAPGQEGQVVVTPLHNFAMPLIRYAVGDFAQRGTPSPCGRSLPVINRVLGRVRNMLTYPDGRKTWPLFADSLLRNAAPVRQFRVIQRSLERLDLQVTAERTLTAAERAALAAVVRDGLDHPFAVEVSEHARIERGPGGKFEDFRSEV